MARPSPGAPNPSDKRTAPRFKLNVPVQITFKGQIGQGQVHDISAVGARIEEATLKPVEGARIALKVSLYAEAVPLVLECYVVRRTESGGFCVSFANADPRIERVLRTVLPKIAIGRVEDPEDNEWSGQMELDLGSELHEQIAELASAEGVEAVEWVRSLIEKSTREALLQRQHAAQSGHDPTTCPDCRRKAMTS